MTSFFLGYTYKIKIILAASNNFVKSTIEKEEIGELKKSVKHKITLQIQPQQEISSDSNANAGNFDVKFVIKVQTQKLRVIN